MKPPRRLLVVFAAAGVAAACVGGLAVAALGWGGPGEGPRTFLIGNSLTWDTVPSRLDGADAGRVRWHVYCGKSLPFIRDHPAGHCVDSSTPWPEALAGGPYDFLVVQPFTGSTRTADAAIVADWAARQPSAVLVIHTSWTTLEEFPAAYESADPDGPMRPSPAYFDALLADLRAALPGREIRTTNAGALLYAVHRDAEAGRGPLAGLSDLGRDPIHLNLGPGRYLAHNALRRALGQPPRGEGFDVEPAVRAYLDEKLAAHGWAEPAPGEPAPGKQPAP